MRADAGYFAGQMARSAHDAKIAFAIGAKRIAPLWRLLAGIAEQDWHDAIDMDNAQVAVAEYCPDWWPVTSPPYTENSTPPTENSTPPGPADTRLLIRRVRLDPAQVSADPRSRRRRTLHPAQRDMLFPDLAQQPAVYAYSFILTNLDVTAPDRAAAVEHWYRHRTTVENIFRDSKHGAALRHPPSGYPRVNLAWMWGALLAASTAAWLHQLTAITAGEDILAGHGVRGGKAMIATLRWRLIAVPRPTDPPRPPPGAAAPARAACSRRFSAGRGTCQSPPDLRHLSPGSPSCPPPASPIIERPANHEPGGGSRAIRNAPNQEARHTKIIYEAGVSSPRYSRNRVRDLHDQVACPRPSIVRVHPISHIHTT